VAKAGGARGADDDGDLELAHGSPLVLGGYELLLSINRGLQNATQEGTIPIPGYLNVTKAFFA
jgi:hypothetical protein